MEKEKAQPAPIPIFPSQDQLGMPILMEHLSLVDKKTSNAGTQDQQTKARNLNLTNKTKLIQKQSFLKRSYKKPQNNQKKQSYKKKVLKLQHKISQLQSQITKLKRKMQCCPQCRYYTHTKDQECIFENFRPNFQEQMKKIAGSLNDSRGSINSVQFQNIDFTAPQMMSKQIGDKAWVYTGILMIAMGSKCLQMDGTINIFRIVKQSVDTLRRQVQKSQKNISMNFFMTNEQMKQINLMQDIGFDPFTEKVSGETGFCLDGVKIQSVEEFELIYDNKLSYNIKYEALLGAMEYLRENSWITF